VPRTKSADEQTSIQLRCPLALRDQFAAVCCMQATDMSHALRQLMIEYVAKHTKGGKRE
jgi:hypothetical protein